MEIPHVTVTDISDLIGNGTMPDARVDLGDVQLNSTMAALLNRVRKTYTRAYKLEWVGNKVPRGAFVGSDIIEWTQNGCVSNHEGKMIGSYDRVMEFGGPNRNLQVMIVYTK